MTVQLVTGSRGWHDEVTMLSVLTRYLKRGDTLVVGDATGADAMAAVIAPRLGVSDVRVFAADWARWGNAAGPIRNREMLAQKPAWVLAFPHSESRGTWDTVRAAAKLGIPVHVYPPGSLA